MAAVPHGEQAVCLSFFLGRLGYSVLTNGLTGISWLSRAFGAFALTDDGFFLQDLRAALPPRWLKDVLMFAAYKIASGRCFARRRDSGHAVMPVRQAVELDEVIVNVFFTSNRQFNSRI